MTKLLNRDMEFVNNLQKLEQQPLNLLSWQMGVEPKIGGKTPKWMVKIMVPNPIKMDDLGVFPIFLETPKLEI